MRAWTTREASRIVGATERQLRHWRRTELVQPSVAAGPIVRCYDFQDLTELRVLVELRRKRLSLQRVRLGLMYLRSRLSHANRPLRELVLETDGRTLFAISGQDHVVDTLARGQQVCRVSLGPVVDHIDNAVLRLGCAAREAV